MRAILCFRGNSIPIRITPLHKGAGMLSIKQKADYSTPGFTYKLENGALSGRLCTMFPVRFKTAWRKTWIGTLLFTGFVAFASDPLLIGEAMLGALFSGPLVLYPLFLIREPGILLRMTPQHFYVGLKRYDLAHVSRFDIKESKFRRFDYVLSFEYGRKPVKIGVRNPHRQALDIALLLNDARKAFLEQAARPQTQDASSMSERSAAF